jgi:signal transduction histidine kinase/ligand-binding sensor domain-containing protein
VRIRVERMRAQSKSVIRATYAVLLLIAAQRALGLPADLTLNQMQHTAWTQRDGAPADASALAQTTDGALWIGTRTGLYRFDGVRFERFKAPDDSTLNGDVSGLLSTDDGGLWIGMRFGDIFFLHDGNLRHYGRKQGLPGRSVFEIAHDKDGTLWALTYGGLFRLESGIWHAYGKEFGLDAENLVDLTIDREGRMWVAGPAGAYMRPPDSERFSRVDLPDTTWSTAQTSDGTMWFSSEGLLATIEVNPATGKRRGLDFHNNRVQFLVPDRDGGIWFGDEGGIGRVRNPAALGEPDHAQYKAAPVQTFGLAQGLTGDFPQVVYEDRVGNVWVGTNGGLDQFRTPKLRIEDRPFAFDAKWALSSDGTLLTAFSRGGVFRGAQSLGEHFDSLLQTDIVAGPDGSMWVAYDGGLEFWTPKGLKPIPLPDAQYGVVQSMALATDGALWVSLVRRGVYTLRGDKWLARGGVQDLPEDVAVSVVADEQGRVWLGYLENRLAIVSDGRAKLLGAADGIRVGSTQAIFRDGDETWIGGSSGVARIVDGRVFAVHAESGQPFEGVSGIAKANDDTLWLNTASGVLRVPAGEISALRKDARHRISFEVFGPDDGLRGTATQLRPLPSAFKEPSGRLWFSTGRNVHSIDPTNIPRSNRAPNVELRSVTVRGVEYPAAERLVLPRRTDQLDIDYTALDITAARKVRFKYRLEGVDHGWIEAGSRRTAFYTNLSHGEYRFQVIAANGDGVWNNAGASMLIVIEPAFYQTGWFLALSVLAALLLAWQVYRLRVRQLTVSLRNRLEARLQERERIARELHDTLLQSTQGLIISLQGAARELPEENPTRERIERTLDRADDILAEGRDRVQDLRALGGMDEDLPRALALAAEELQELRAINVHLNVSGEARPLRRRAREETYRIAREALVNAFKHSEASTIDVLVDYEAGSLRVTVRDNGRGAPAEKLEHDDAGGHWGLRGMRERARELGAGIEVRSTLGAGVTMELTVPASAAYSIRKRWGFFGKSIKPE